MSDLERVALVDNLLDRVHQLEQRYAELSSGVVAIQEVVYRETPGEGLLSGWVATGTAFRDVGSRIVLDATLPGITLASGGVIRSADYVAGVSGFRIDGGLAEFNNVTVRGTIHATAGSIAGWTIASGHLYAGSGSTRTGLRPADFPFYAGSETPSTAPFRVTPAGALTASNAIITGAITATSGAFTGTVTVGTVSPRIEIDGANARIRSSDYVAGQRGITMEASGFAEFGNVDIRGALKAAVFEYGQILVTGGTLVIARAAGKLLNDCTSVDAPETFNVDIEDPDGMSHAAAGALWSVNDCILLHDAAVGTLWATVSSKTDMSTYWRLVCVKQSPGAGTNYTFRRGMAVVNYGQSGQGFLHLTADETNAPYYSVRTHAGSPWSAQTELARLGNLNGNWGYSSATYGIALGEYASGKANLTWDPTNGLRLRTHATTVIQLDNAGNARIEGVLNVGTSGGIYQGTGTFSSPTTGLKIWNDSGIGRIAGYNAGVLQWGAGTDGRLRAGGGNVTIDADGISILAPDYLVRQSSIVWSTSGGDLRSRLATNSAGMLEIFGRASVSICAGDTPNQRIYVSYNSVQVQPILNIMGTLEVNAVSTNPNPGEIYYLSNLRPVRSGTAYTAYAVVPLTTALTHPSLNGGSLNVGTYSIGPVGSGANYEFNYPAAARGLMVRLSARWSTANHIYAAYLIPFGRTSAEGNPMVRATAANIASDDSGITMLDSNGRAQIVVTGANATSVWVSIMGYLI